MNHGHLPLTKKLKTEEICWKYGEKGYFNFIIEAHLHSRIQKLSVAQRGGFQLLKEDSIDSRRQVCPSIFRGNPYSEGLGFSTLPGYLLVTEGKNKRPRVVDNPL